MMVPGTVARNALRGLLATGLAVLLLWSGACAPGETETGGGTDEGSWSDPASRANGRPTFLAFRVETVDSAVAECDRDSRDRCTRIHLSYVVFPDAPDPLQTALHSRVAELMMLEVEVGSGGADMSARVLEDAAARYAHGFLGEFRAYSADFPDSPQAWTVERSLSVRSASPSFVTLALEEMAYTGGAHANSRAVYLTLDAGTGEPLGLPDLLSPGFEEPLTVAGEVAFREARGLSPDEPLIETGFFTSTDGRFALNGNFAPVAEGLAFHYDAYEINAYAAGPTDLVIPWAEIREWVRPDGPLASFLR